MGTWAVTTRIPLTGSLCLETRIISFKQTSCFSHNYIRNERVVVSSSPATIGPSAQAKLRLLLHRTRAKHGRPSNHQRSTVAEISQTLKSRGRIGRYSDASGAFSGDRYRRAWIVRIYRCVLPTNCSTSCLSIGLGR